VALSEKASSVKARWFANCQGGTDRRKAEGPK
jgi:hypothetical protein